ncbi:PAS domain-containing methyl-accepting chemotaxis protein [Brevundimonas sp.]|uniref:methyl-accepting chemotaxis protein n=1 Tax=Brevundimonas sp. TaxID=1871086 RepID=UPI00260E227D|nr:PAS domain-containing methyl-accepting chemotaxis protein [Brevundimonas sp.]
MLFSKAAHARKAAADELRELKAQVAAMDRSQAVIEFKLDGTILRANTNFLNTLGYRSEEIVGQHHRMFVPPGEASSADYTAFWDELRAGRFVARKFLRVTKQGSDCWIQASYNPVLDEEGKPYKVIKFATDVTAVENERTQGEVERKRLADEQDEIVGNLAASLKRMADGDLTAQITAEFKGSYAQIKADFNTALAQLQEAMSVVVNNVSAIRSGSGEISQAADDLSRRTEQQAASLEETAAALDEITATVNRTASGARQASETVQAAKGDAETSGNVVRDAVSAMGAIEKSAQEISQIIGVIDEIAFQTNLLALNAGVEAARAGDAGRGFAVVASEVRALAQRSAEAAKEIKTLISASTSQVNAGVALVGQTGEALQRIVSRVAEIDGLVSEIAASAQEQATGLQQVNTAVNQMDQVTQQNAAMVEQSTAASHSLSQEAEALANSVSRFEIGEGAAPARAVRAPARSAPAPVRPANRPVTQMRATGSGGAARKPQPVVSEDGWEEF